MKIEQLNSLNRQINLENQLSSDWKNQTKGLINWFKLVRSIDDFKLQKICGTDIALYLIWLRYCSMFFMALSLINIVIITIYVSGNPVMSTDEEKDESILQVLTILNIQDNKVAVVSIFFYSMILVSGFVIAFQFKYMTKFQTGVKLNDDEELESAVNG